jgi:hypothetical protein
MATLRRQFMRITDRFAGHGHAIGIQYRPVAIEVTDSGLRQPRSGKAGAWVCDRPKRYLSTEKSNIVIPA